MKTNDVIHAFGERLINVLYNNRVYIYTIVVNSLIFIIGLIVTGCIPFGDESFVFLII